jgi:hypothetical protein
MKAKNLISDDYWLTGERVPLYTVEHSEEELAYYTFKLTSEVLKERSKLKYASFVAKKVLRTMRKPRLFVRALKSAWSNRSW